MSIELELRVFKKTDKAFLVGDREEDAVWVPESQLEDYTEVRDGYATFVFSDWLAREKGLA